MVTAPVFLFPTRVRALQCPSIGVVFHEILNKQVRDDGGGRAVAGQRQWEARHGSDHRRRDAGLFFEEIGPGVARRLFRRGYAETVRVHYKAGS